MVAEHFVVACGAWSGKLLKGLPIRPVKGQMLCLKPLPGSNQSNTLQHVLFGRDVYVVSKENCSMYYVGATVEDAGFDRCTTAGGVLKLLNAATKLVPGFADYHIAETWAGLRPGTPDQSPIIGHTDFSNVTVASGTYRNGILLAPVMGKMTAACAMGEKEGLSAEMQSLLPKFSINRFLDSSSPVKRSAVEQKQSAPDVPDASALNGTKLGVQTPPPKSVQKAVSNSLGEQGVMMWQIMADGSKRAIRPGARFLQKMRNESKPSLSNGVVNNEPQEQEQQLEQQEDTAIGAPDWSEVNVSNDAYDDVMQHRDNAEETLLAGTAASRSFGRTKSSLEDQGQVLSMSAEEEAVFDAAFEAAKNDIRSWRSDALQKDNFPNVPDNTAFLQGEFP